MDQVKAITVFVLGFALLLPMLSLLRLRLPRCFAAAKWVILVVYAAAYLQETLLFRDAMASAVWRWEPLWSYRKALALPQGFEGLLRGVVKITDGQMLSLILLNILLFVPMGYLLPFFFRLKGWQVLLTGLGVSAMTEAIQLLGRIGWCETDDIINNMLGCLLGLAIWLCLRPLCRPCLQKDAGGA